MFNLNQKKMQEIMRQMGMSQESFEADRVVIERKDGGKITILNPSVARISIHGQESFQISGEISEGGDGFSQEDVKTIVEKTGCSEKQAFKALEDSNGDLANAILSLKG
jgi:nascent polypeptide-associated complex subunit alpha